MACRPIAEAPFVSAGWVLLAASPSFALTALLVATRHRVLSEAALGFVLGFVCGALRANYTSPSEVVMMDLAIGASLGGLLLAIFSAAVRFPHVLLDPKWAKFVIVGCLILSLMMGGVSF